MAVLLAEDNEPSLKALFLCAALPVVLVFVFFQTKYTKGKKKSTPFTQEIDEASCKLALVVPLRCF